MSTKAFTLIELLVVIAILAVLAVAVTLILNPAELIRQGRDSTRLSDLATINRALGLYQTDRIAKWMGTSTVVYTSLPDTTSTCASYGLPSLPSGWEYNCVQSSSSTKVDGSGWIPVDFTSMSFSSPLSRLPLDPVNEATSSKYYTYVSGGSWELSAVMEASSNKLGGDNDKVSNDGGEYMDIYETGTNLELLPVNRNPNLVGYWKFDEGTGLSAYDASGRGNDGTISVGTSSVQWVSGRKNGALDFDGVDDYVDAGNNESLNFGNSSFSGLAWVKPNNAGVVMSKEDLAGPWIGWYFYIFDLNTLRIKGDDGPVGFTVDKDIPSGSFYDGWHFVAFVMDKKNDLAKLYYNGISIGSENISTLGSLDDPTHFNIGGRDGVGNFNGSIDEAHIYNRALSEAEIEAMYNSY